MHPCLPPFQSHARLRQPEGEAVQRLSGRGGQRPAAAVIQARELQCPKQPDWDVFEEPRGHQPMLVSQDELLFGPSASGTRLQPINLQAFGSQGPSIAVPCCEREPHGRIAARSPINPQLEVRRVDQLEQVEAVAVDTFLRLSMVEAL